VRLIQQEIKRLYRETVSDLELNRAKEQLKGNLLLSLESTSNRMSRLAKIELYHDQLLTPEESVAKVEAVTAADVLRIAAEMFGAEEPVITAIGPFKK
jgi:predicted Zn-dependent peptidase